MLAFLDTFFLLPWMLAGLAVLAIPPIIHLLNRRRYDIVDWGAMQFLQISEVTRRRFMIEEVLLMLVRMGLLAVLVCALAGPFVIVSLPAALSSRPSRDVVLVLDGSASMAASDEVDGSTPAKKAKDWASAFVHGLGPSDGVALLLARDQVSPLAGTLGHDRSRLQQKLEQLPPPAGSCDWAEGVRQAFSILETAQNRRRDIILLGDDQRFSFADPESLFRWELLASERRGKTPSQDEQTRLWYVNVAGERASQPANYGLAPLSVNRPVVPIEREVTFRSDIVLSGQSSYSPPHRIRLEVDGKQVRDLPSPGGTGSAKLPLPKDGKVSFSFTHRFAQAGSHLVSVILEPDLPPESRPAGYTVRDRVPGDNRQDYSVEVISALPVLLVTGEKSEPSRVMLASDFLRDALAPARDRQPVVQLRILNRDDFTPEMLNSEPRPRVLILHDVPRLEPAQAEAITTYLANGGGVLIAPGEQVDAAWYNEQLYRGGEGWLPARLDGLGGDESKPKDAARPDPASCVHPVLELFHKVTVGGLSEARFPRWWKLTTPGQHAPGVPVGQLLSGASKYPFLVERSFQAGRVLLASVPLDGSWGNNLIDLQAFVPLVHEAVYYLAGARTTEYNLRPGQPIRHRFDSDFRLAEYRFRPPFGPLQPLTDQPGEVGSYLAQVIRHQAGALLVFDGVRDSGVYELHTPQKQVVYYAVPGDAREVDLTACNKEDRKRVADLIGLRYEDDRDVILEPPGEGPAQQDLWLYFLLALIGLLLLEVWMTRRAVLNRV